MSKEVPSVWSFFFPKKNEPTNIPVNAPMNNQQPSLNMKENNQANVFENKMENKMVNNGMFMNEARMGNVDAMYEEIMKLLESIFELVRQQAIREKELEEVAPNQKVNRRVKTSFTRLRNKIAKLHDALEETPEVRAELYNEIGNKINQNREFVNNMKLNQVVNMNNKRVNNANMAMTPEETGEMNRIMNTEQMPNMNTASTVISPEDIQKLREVLAGIDTIYRPNAPNVRNARMNQKASRLQQDRKNVEELLQKMNIDLSIPVAAPDMDLKSFLSYAYETVNDLIERRVFPKPVFKALYGMRAGLRWAVRHLEENQPKNGVPAPANTNIIPLPTNTSMNMPRANMPQANIPPMNMPQANIPPMNMPQANIPPMNMPRANMPRANMPQANLPPMNMPRPNNTSVAPMVSAPPASEIFNASQQAMQPANNRNRRNNQIPVSSKSTNNLLKNIFGNQSRVSAPATTPMPPQTTPQLGGRKNRKN